MLMSSKKIMFFLQKPSLIDCDVSGAFLLLLNGQTEGVVEVVPLVEGLMQVHGAGLVVVLLEEGTELVLEETALPQLAHNMKLSHRSLVVVAVVAVVVVVVVVVVAAAAAAAHSH